MSGHIKQLTKLEYYRLLNAGRDPTEDYEDLEGEGTGDEDSPSGGDKGGGKPPGPFVPPPGVSGITAVTGTDEETGLAWISLTWNPSTGAGYYEIRWKAEAETIYASGTSETESFLIEGLTPGTTYHVNVQAYKNSGVKSGYGDDISVVAAVDTGIPNTPTGLNVAAALQKIYAWWAQSVEPDFSHYKVYVYSNEALTSQVAGSPFRSDSSVFIYAPLATSVQSTFWVQVAAVDLSGNESPKTTAVSSLTGKANAAEIIIGGTIIGDLIAAGTITGIQLQDGSVSSIKIASTIQSDNFITGVSGWRIRRSTGDAEFQSATIRGTLVAGSITSTWSVTAAGKFVAGSESGAHVEMNTNGLFVYNDDGLLVGTFARTGGTNDRVQIWAGTIQGAVFRTAAVGAARVVMSESSGEADRIKFYNSPPGGFQGSIYAATSGGIFADADFRVDGLQIGENRSGQAVAGAAWCRIYKVSGSKTLRVRWNDGTTNTIQFV